MWGCASLGEETCVYVLLVKNRPFPWEADEKKARTQLYLLVDLALQVNSYCNSNSSDDDLNNLAIKGKGAHTKSEAGRDGRRQQRRRRYLD
jgi:hypothetical protein